MPQGRAVAAEAALQIFANVSGGPGIMILNGWKEIAAYVNSSVRTVQRWEKAGMPVVRPLPSSRGSVIAHSEQLDSWLGRQPGAVFETSPSQAQVQQEDFRQNLACARSLTREVRAARLQMRDQVSMLKANVALLKNLIRMTSAGAFHTSELAAPPRSSAETKAPAAMQLRRWS